MRKKEKSPEDRLLDAIFGDDRNEIPKAELAERIKKAKDKLNK